jgi:hypothetical protein
MQAKTPDLDAGRGPYPERAAWRCVLAASLVLAGGCAAMADRTDYHRHTMSDLREDWRQPGTFVFDATTSSLYPTDSAEAEAKRMEWLAGWMKRLGYCPAGWEVLGRREIPVAERLGAKHDLRYEVRCTSGAHGGPG